MIEYAGLNTADLGGLSAQLVKAMETKDKLQAKLDP
jgi:hypothetical protein